METPLRTSALPVWLLDPVTPTVEAATHGAYRLEATQRSWLLPIAGAVVLLALSAVGWLTDPKQFYFSYLVGWVFCLSIALGSLFFVMIHHLTRSHWAVVVRRIAEVAAMSFPLLAVLFIPILIGMHDLFHWTHAELYDPSSPQYDEILAGKQSYLNVPFFVARMVLYFAFWILLSTKLYRLSLRQDVDPDHDIPRKQRWWCALGMPFFAVSLAFGSYDFLMSLDPHWFSTIFGVYFFAGAFWTAVAFIAITALLLQRSGSLQGIVSTNHYHDLGKWMFAFTIFWAYIAFSQYMLIWYGHLEEEEIWYEHRLSHGWGYHSAALVIMHFILPFLILLFQSSKKSRALVAIMAVWFFVMQWFDLHWLALPVLTAEQVAEGHHASTFHWLDLTTWLGLFALFIGMFARRLSRHPLVPVNDPRLGRSLDHANV